MKQIQIIGIKELDEMELEAVNRIADKGYDKIKRELKNEVSITVHVKSHNKQGSQRKYSVHVKVMAPTRIFTSTHAVDWNLETALHKSFEEVAKMIQHAFHTDNQHKKTYG
ncbi:MAG: hypothetical protein AABX34_02645 [Nanoarchaeota archaeon]